MSTARRALLPWLAGLLAALALGACGGGGDDDTERSAGKAGRGYDLDALAKKTVGPNRTARSGRIEGKITITVKGVRRFEDPVPISASGRYEYRAGASLPDYELLMGLRARRITLLSAAGRSYLKIDDTGYEIPDRARDVLVESAARGRNGLTRTLEQFGIAPWRWEIDKRAAGTEVVDGVQSVHITTGVDVPRLLADANTLGALLESLGVARANGLPDEIPRKARSVLSESVSTAKGASWIGVSDGVMRKAGLTIRFRIPKAKRKHVSGIRALTVVASMRLTDAGRPQEISPPQKTAPFRNLALAFDALGDYEDARR